MIPSFDNSRIMEEQDVIRALAALAAPIRLRAFRTT